MWAPASTQTHPFLFTEGNLGVPRKALSQAYMVAVRAYFELRNESRKSVPSLWHSTALDRLTRVVLLANPAHQTALNSRKKLVQTAVVEPHWELHFSSSLLSCRECAKESILWHHRRWLLNVIHKTSSTSDTDNIPETVPHRALEAELVSVSTACHLYPRNYHAWTHRRLCVEALITSPHPGAPPNSDALAEEYQKTLKWIESHVSDYSAMNHAIHLEKMLAGEKPCLSTSAHATSLLRSYPDHESLWIYLRGSETDRDEKESVMSMKEAPSARGFFLRHIVWRKVSVSAFPATPAVNCLKKQTKAGRRGPAQAVT